MKLCSECKHMDADQRCRLSPKEPDYVYGQPVGYRLAQVERESFVSTGCGPEGKNWERK